MRYRSILIIILNNTIKNTRLQITIWEIFDNNAAIFISSYTYI